jgi:RNA polymerase sigma-54 factor
VSRAIAHKYVETPQGLLPFRNLFDRGVQQGAASPDAASSEAVKTMIKTLIEQENAAESLSDEAIVEMVARRGGAKIARRTVAKYREELRIPASFQRRQQAIVTHAGNNGNGRASSQHHHDPSNGAKTA